MASAFNAPIGGRGVVHLRRKGDLLEHTIDVASVFLYHDYFGDHVHAEIDKLFSFGEFNSLTKEHSNFSM